jgi:hypothetical protein
MRVALNLATIKQNLLNYKYKRGFSFDRGGRIVAEATFASPSAFRTSYL